MLSLARQIAAVLIMVGFAVPAAGAEPGGLRKACLEVIETGQEMARQAQQSAAEQFEDAVKAAVNAEGSDYDALSDEEKRTLWLVWRDNVSKVPLLLGAFCALYEEGRLPGLGADIPHGSLNAGWEFSVKFGEPGKASSDEETDGCGQTYWVAVEQDEAKTRTKYVFCESGGSFGLVSAHMADPDAADGWRRID